MELEAAIFDLGGVLTSPILDSFKAFERKLGLPEHALVRMFAMHTDRSTDPDFHQLETGRLSEAEYYARIGTHIRRELGVEVEWPADPAEIRRGLWGGIRRNEQMIAAVERIARHYKTALLTNNVKEWADWRQHYPIRMFDAVVDSYEVGVRKPDPKIFHLTCERLGVEPSKASFVDDIPANVEAARNLGMQAILFTSTGEVLARLRPFFPKAFASESTRVAEP